MSELEQSELQQVAAGTLVYEVSPEPPVATPCPPPSDKIYS